MFSPLEPRPRGGEVLILVVSQRAGQWNSIVLDEITKLEGTRPRCQSRLPVGPGTGLTLEHPMGAPNILLWSLHLTGRPYGKQRGYGGFTQFFPGTSSAYLVRNPLPCVLCPLPAICPPHQSCCLSPIVPAHTLMSPCASLPNQDEVRKVKDHSSFLKLICASGCIPVSAAQ